MNPEGPTRAGLFAAYGSLLLLLAATAAASSLPLGAFKAPLALAIAAAKAFVIFTVFMQLRYERGLVRVFALAGFFWLGILGSLTLADYLTR